MGAKVAVDTTGLARFRELARIAARRVLEQEAELTVQDAKQRAPVDTGALRDSLAWERVGENAVEVHDGVFYGIYNELGTVKMAARPFLSPALDQMAERLPVHLRAALAAVLEEAG